MGEIPYQLELCYTLTMETDRHIWRVWAIKLQRLGVVDVAAGLLDAVGPLAVLGAQFVYIGQPVFDRLLPGEQLNALARMLEDPQLTRSFVKFLREEDSVWQH